MRDTDNWPLSRAATDAVSRAIEDAYRKGVIHGRDEGPSSEADRLRRVLERIAIVEQGCGGNLTYEEMAKSAMLQAKDALLFCPPLPAMPSEEPKT